MSFKYCWTISSSHDFQVHQQHSQRRCCFSQNALLWFKVLPDLSPALSGLLPAHPGLPPALPGSPRFVVGGPRYSEGCQESPPRVWYSPEIDASKFTLHILSDTSGGFQWLKYILLMWHADLGSWIQRHIEKTDRAKLSLETVQCTSLLCSMLSHHKYCDCSLGAQL